jgi:hypothetical protein
LREKVIYTNRKEKWWFFLIRGMNLFAFRYWWLFWILFLFAIWWIYPCIIPHKDPLCVSIEHIQEKSYSIINSMNNCCTCAPPPGTAPCNTNIAESGGRGYFKKLHDLGSNPGQVNIKYNMLSVPDKMEIFYDNILVASTGSLISGTGNLSFNYNAEPGKPRYCTVVLTAPKSGTEWNYYLGCPK